MGSQCGPIWEGLRVDRLLPRLSTACRRGTGRVQAEHRHVPCGGRCGAAADDMGIDGRRGPTPTYGDWAVLSGYFSVCFCPSFSVRASAQGPIPKGCPVSPGGKGS